MGGRMPITFPLWDVCADPLGLKNPLGDCQHEALGTYCSTKLERRPEHRSAFRSLRGYRQRFLEEELQRQLHISWIARKLRGWKVEVSGLRPKDVNLCSCISNWRNVIQESTNPLRMVEDVEPGRAGYFSRHCRMYISLG